MIEISHESPIKMLKESLKYNDYDYCLVHLLEKHKEYLDFYTKSIKTRKMYLDNSIFELGKAFDSEKFKLWCEYFCKINEKNFYYIVPDSLENINETIQNFDNFKYGRGNRIGVVQGKTKKECIECFDYMKGKCDIIAISFDYSWFGLKNSLIERAENRVKFLYELKELGKLNNTKIHLLGCYVPQEFKMYDIPEIVSLDTSNPVLHGLLGISYTSDGLSFKESLKLADLIDYNKEIPDITYFNIGMFRIFVNGINN